MRRCPPGRKRLWLLSQSWGHSAVFSEQDWLRFLALLLKTSGSFNLCSYKIRVIIHTQEGIRWNDIAQKQPEIVMIITTTMTVDNVSLEAAEDADINTYDSVHLCLPVLGVWIGFSHWHHLLHTTDILILLSLFQFLMTYSHQLCPL